MDSVTSLVCARMAVKWTASTTIVSVGLGLLMMNTAELETNGLANRTMDSRGRPRHGRGSDGDRLQKGEAVNCKNAALTT